MRLFLFDDETARGWEPFALTRPVGELLLGAYLLRERAEAFFGVPCAGHLGRPELVGFEEEGAPPVLSAGDDETTPPPREGAPTALLLSRAVLGGADPTGTRFQVPPFPESEEPVPLRVGGLDAGWLLPPGYPLPESDELSSPESAQRRHPGLDLPGRVLRRPCELVERNTERLSQDLAAWAASPPPGWRRVDTKAPLASGVERLGDHPLLLGRGAVIEPGVVLDLTHGPVALGPGTRVRSFTLVEGPTLVARGSILLGGPIARLSAGPMSRLRGEVADSVVLGYANKAHDGHLGHAYLGRWVNLGAMTTNSDLKNNYGPVRLSTSRGKEETGLLKLGCLLGDHVKTAIGTLLGTGVTVGAGANLFGEGTVSEYVPPFSWGSGPEAGLYDRRRFLDVARTVMERRDLSLSAGMEELLTRAWHRSAEDRETPR